MTAQALVLAGPTAIVTIDAPTKPVVRAGNLPISVIAAYEPKLASTILDKFDLTASVKKGAAAVRVGDLYGKVSATEYQKLEVIAQRRNLDLAWGQGLAGFGAVAGVMPLAVGLATSIGTLDVVGGLSMGVSALGLFIWTLVRSDMPPATKALIRKIDQENA